MSLHHLFQSLLHHPHSVKPPVEEEGHVISRRLHELLDGTESEYRKGSSDMPSADVSTGRHESRRSTRVPMQVQIDAKDVAEPLTCEGETIVVNLHGASILTTAPLHVGMRIELRVILTDKHALADVVYVDPYQPKHCGIGFVKPYNIWRVSIPPDDWATGDPD